MELYHNIWMEFQTEYSTSNNKLHNTPNKYIAPDRN